VAGPVPSERFVADGTGGFDGVHDVDQFAAAHHPGVGGDDDPPEFGAQLAPVHAGVAVERLFHPGREHFDVFGRRDANLDMHPVRGGPDAPAARQGADEEPEPELRHRRGVQADGVGLLGPAFGVEGRRDGGRGAGADLRFGAAALGSPAVGAAVGTPGRFR
jgi:hypothetical protein